MRAKGSLPSKPELLILRADGKIIEGQFKEGKAHGHVTLTEKNGKSRKAVYTKGQFMIWT